MPAATLLDSLLIELGLDSSRFQAGAEEATRATRKARDETEKSAREIRQAVGEGVSDAFQKATRRALEFISVLAGAHSIEQFTVRVTQGATQLGIMAQALGMAPDRVSAIGMAVERAGGSAEATVQSLQRVKDKMVDVQVNGGAVPPAIQRLPGVDFYAAKTPEELINSVVEAMAKSPRHLSRSQQISILTSSLGVDQATATFWVDRGASGERQAVGQAQRDAVTPAQVTAATQLTSAWYGAAQAVQSVGREIVRYVTPAVTSILSQVRELVEQNKRFVTEWVGDKIKEAVKWLSDPATWQGVKGVIDDVRQKVDAVAEATGGWGNLAKILVGVWALDKIAPVLFAVGLLTTAFRGLAGSLLLVTAGQMLTEGLAALLGTTKSTSTGETIVKGTELPGTPGLATNPFAGLPSVEWMKNTDVPLFLRPFMTPDQYHKSVEDWNRVHRHRSLNRRTSWWMDEGPMHDRPISTSEGPVSEGRPLPVKVVGAPAAPVTPPPASSDSGPPPAADAGSKTSEKPGILSRTWHWLTGGGGAVKDPPPSSPTSLRAPPVALPPTSTLLLPMPHPSTGAYGASFSALNRAHSIASARQSSSRVTVEAMNFHSTTQPVRDRREEHRQRIRRDFFAMKSDVGLA